MQDVHLSLLEHDAHDGRHGKHAGAVVASPRDKNVPVGHVDVHVEPSHTKPAAVHAHCACEADSARLSAAVHAVGGTHSAPRSVKDGGQARQAAEPAPAHAAHEASHRLHRGGRRPSAASSRYVPRGHVDTHDEPSAAKPSAHSKQLSAPGPSHVKHVAWQLAVPPDGRQLPQPSQAPTTSPHPTAASSKHGTPAGASTPYLTPHRLLSLVSYGSDTGSHGVVEQSVTSGHARDARTPCSYPVFVRARHMPSVEVHTPSKHRPGYPSGYKSLTSWHSAPLGRYTSRGHTVLSPVHTSAESHAPSRASRHTVPAASTVHDDEQHGPSVSASQVAPSTSWQTAVQHGPPSHASPLSRRLLPVWTEGGGRGATPRVVSKRYPKTRRDTTRSTHHKRSIGVAAGRCNRRRCTRRRMQNTIRRRRSKSRRRTAVHRLCRRTHCSRRWVTGVCRLGIQTHKLRALRRRESA